MVRALDFCPGGPGLIPRKDGIFFQLCFIPLLRLSCRKNINTLIQELGSTKTYERIFTDERSIVNTHSIDITAKFAVGIKENQDKLPTLY